MSINQLENKLKKLDNELYVSLTQCKSHIKPYLKQFKNNFIEFTDHSFEHVEQVAQNASDLLDKEEINNLNSDEIYILIMACYLHDIGMCVPKDSLLKITKYKTEYETILKQNPEYKIEDYIRDIHHILSYDFIIKRWKDLKIYNEEYAKLIALIAKAHRKENLLDFNVYKFREFVKPSGNEIICMPYLGCVIRIADEMDITNLRVPDILFYDYLPDNTISRLEWEKHHNTWGINKFNDRLILRANATDLYVYNALLDMKNKLEDCIKYAHKVIELIPGSIQRKYSLKVKYVEENISKNGFIFKDIGFSFDLENVFQTFFSTQLYYNKYDALREIFQNAIDNCNYKKTLYIDYIPKIEVELIKSSKNRGKLIIRDNGLGMNEFILKNFFSKMAANNYYSKKGYESIGKFGVGVFSFFMIADYFEVNTKMQDQEALRFRIIKSANNYFKFFDDNLRNDVGTDITLYLNTAVNNELTQSKLLELITHYLRFIKIEVKIIINDEVTYLQKRSVKSINENNILRELISFDKIDRTDELIIVKFQFNNELFEGYICLIVGKNNNKISLSKLTELCWGRDNYRNLNVNISQKGIFITSFSSEKLSLKPSFGEINIKKNINISLNRSSFNFNDNILTKIKEIITDKLLKKIFKEWSILKINEKYEQGLYLIRDYLSQIALLHNEKILKDNLIIKVYYNKKSKFTTFIKFFSKFKKFSLYTLSELIIRKFNIGYNDKNHEKLKENISLELMEIEKKYSNPIIFFPNFDISSLFGYYFLKKKYNIEIFIEKTRTVFVVSSLNKENLQLENGNYYKNLGNPNILGISMTELFGHISPSIIYNNKNVINQYFKEYTDNSTYSKETKELIKQFYNKITNLMINVQNAHLFNEYDLKELNRILKHINQRLGTAFNVNINSFPKYYFPDYVLLNITK